MMTRRGPIGDLVGVGGTKQLVGRTDLIDRSVTVESH